MKYCFHFTCCRYKYLCLSDIEDVFDYLCIVAEITCESGKTKCPNSNKCLERRFLCDGDNDCGDNSDENPLFCRKVTCPSGNIVKLTTWMKIFFSLISLK